MANTIKLKIKVDEDGNLKVIARDSKAAAEGLERTGKSARTADRQLKGAAKASANSTKNFSKLAQGITGGLVPAYATLAANIFAISAAFNFFKRAADVSILVESQTSFAQSTGTALKSVTANLREASDGLLGFREAAQAAAIGAAKGFSPKQLEDLASGARKASAALGRDFEDAFDRLIRGTSKAEPELLDELGITLRLEEATNRYATAINKTADTLTTFERSQAVLVETQRQLDEQFGGVETGANAFVKLQKTFEDLVKSVTQAFLPIVEGFANIINSSAPAAIAVFGALAVSIAKAALPFGAIGQAAENFEKKQSAAVFKAKREIVAYRKEIEETKRATQDLQAQGKKELKSSAAQVLKGGSESKILQKIDRGEALRPQDQATLKRSLKAAEKQYREFGEIKTGIFKGANIQVVKSTELALKKIETSTKKTTTRVQAFWKNTYNRIRLGAAQTSAAVGKSFSAASKAGAAAAAGFSKALRFAGVIGIIVLVGEAFLSLYRNVYDISLAIVRLFGKAAEFIAGIYSKAFAGIIDGYASVLEFFNQDDAAAKARQNAENLRNAAEGLGDKIVNSFKESNFAQNFLKPIQDSAQASAAAGEAFKAFSEDIKVKGGEAESIIKALGKETDTTEKAIKGLTAVSTLQFTKQLDQLDVVAKADPGRAQEGFETLKETIAGLSSELPLFGAAAIQSATSLEELRAALEKVEIQAGTAIAAKISYRESLTSLQDILRTNNTSLFDVARALNVASEAGEQAKTSLSEVGVGFDPQAEAARQTGLNVAELTNLYNGLIETEKKLREEQAKLNLEAEQITRLGSVQEKAAKELLSLKQAELEIERKRQEIAIQTEAVRRAENTADYEQELLKLQDLENGLAVIIQKAANVKFNISDIGKVANTVADSFQTGMVSAFDGVIQGTKSVKQAFADLATSILRALSKVISELLVVKLLQASIFQPGGALSFLAPTARQGGILEPSPSLRMGGIAEPKGYSGGGIARGRQAGYPAILHGTEAVVPLPNGKEIPVQMMNGGNQSSNVVVNVNIDNNGNAQQNSNGDQAQGVNLGNAIAAAVQRELQNQKRSGGILNPYGAA